MDDLGRQIIPKGKAIFGLRFQGCESVVFGDVVWSAFQFTRRNRHDGA